MRRVIGELLARLAARWGSRDGDARTWRRGTTGGDREAQRPPADDSAMVAAGDSRRAGDDPIEPAEPPANDQKSRLSCAGDAVDPEGDETLRPNQEFPFVHATTNGHRTVNRPQLVDWFHDHIEHFTQNLAIIDGELRAWEGRRWKVCLADDVERLIGGYFTARGLPLSSATVAELRKQLFMRPERLAKLALRDHRDRIVIPFLNGTLYLDPSQPRRDWITFRRQHWDRSDGCIFLIEAEYQPWMVRTDRWRGTLVGHYFRDHYQPDDIAAIQQFLGSVLIPDLNHQQALVIVGPGGSGKSTVAETFQRLFSADCVSSLNAASWGTAHLNVAMMTSVINVSNEVDGRQLAAKTFKAVIAQDPLTFNPKFKTPVRVKPRAKHLFTVNDLPRLDPDYAVKRRLVFVEARKHVPLDQQSPTFKQDFEGQKLQLLNFALRGLKRLVDADYLIRHQNDDLLWKLAWKNEPVLMEFAADRLVFEPAAEAPLDPVYEAFCAWKAGHAQAGKLVDKAAFSTKVTNVAQVLGHHVQLTCPQDEAGRRVVVFSGFRLKADDGQAGGTK